MTNKPFLLFALAVAASTAALMIAAVPLSAQVTVTDTHEGGKPVPKPAPFNMKSATQAQNVSRHTGAAQHQNSQGTLLGNRKSTLLGNTTVASSASSSKGSKVSLNPQPFPPRTGKTLVGNSAAASGASVKTGTSKTGTGTTATQMKLHHTGATPLVHTQTKSIKGTSGAGGNATASPQ